MRSLVKIGLPASLQILAEVSAFLAATIIIGTMGVDALASHQVAITCAATVFMVPLGLSQALTVRVGEAWGARAYERWRTRAYELDLERLSTAPAPGAPRAAAPLVDADTLRFARCLTEAADRISRTESGLQGDPARARVLAEQMTARCLAQTLE